MSLEDARRCGRCEALLYGSDFLCEDCKVGYYSVTNRLRWLRRSVPSWSMLEAFQELIRSASLHGHILCTSDGHPIPESSYRRRTGGPSDIRS